MKEKYILGIDVSKDKLSIHNNKNDSFVEIKNSVKALDKYLFKNKTNLSFKTHKVGLESTGDYSYLPMRYFFEKKFNTILLNPLLTKKYNRYSVRNKKTDKTDSKMICKMIQDGEGQSVCENTLEINKKTALRTEQNFTAIRSDLKRLRKSLELKKENGILVDCLLNEVDALIFSLKESSDKVLKEVNSKENITRQEKVIVSLPGFGIKNSAVVSSEFGDIKRFCNPKQMVAYAGLDSSVYQSGDKEIRGRISKRGSSLLRKALYQSAFVSSRHDPNMIKFYAKKKKEGKLHKVILNAIGKKLINRIFVLVRKDKMK